MKYGYIISSAETAIYAQEKTIEYADSSRYLGRDTQFVSKVIKSNKGACSPTIGPKSHFGTSILIQPSKMEVDIDAPVLRRSTQADIHIHLKNTFDKIDQNNDGLITIHEILNYICQDQRTLNKSDKDKYVLYMLSYYEKSDLNFSEFSDFIKTFEN